ncbi:huntingtin-interacting protein 1-related protein-like isoform X2 [Conger conger]|uniref:huntingtin-interacting protein 1-related protein-like isoform X2 n=1 Tax=Conger conger TaxID=82655 RepID=UPI002A5AF990|nr:huntingtin-interacting protein 1-related protein-like isoform X2 [Conger conger]
MISKQTTALLRRKDDELSSISKAISNTEAPVKEKHARRIILGTYREKGAFTFWSYAQGLPLASSAILSWKFCHVLHKVLRDGHQNTLQDCARHKSSVMETGRFWANLHDHYGQLVALYANLLITKMDFHMKHAEIRANLEVSDEVLERAAGTDINNVFQMTVEVLDYMDVELKVAETVIRQLNTSIAISTTTSGQCRLSPLIQVIQDSSHLYHFTVKLLFKLHACLPLDTLQGHRDRFHDQFHSLKGFFNKCRDMMYFKRLIQIPKLPDSPPNFLRASALAEHVKPVVVMADEDPPEEDDGEPLVEFNSTPQHLTAFQMQPQPPPQPQLDIFDQTFGPPNGGFDPKDLQIDSLKQEIEFLKAELERMKTEAQRYITQLKSQINSLEAELEEQRAQKQRALVENEQLRMELEALRRHTAETDQAQLTYMETERRAQDSELRYTKLKEKHAELVSNHAELLRKSADTVKMLSASQQTQEEVARTRQQLAFEVESIKQESDMKLEEQKFEVDKLRRELEEKMVELQRTQASLQTNTHTGERLSSEMLGLQAQKETLLHAVSEKDAELSSLRQTAQTQQSSLQQEREKSARDMDELQSKLRDKLSREEQLQQQLLEDQFSLLQGTVTEAQSIIQDAVDKLDDPLHLRCTSSPDYLVSRAEATLDSIDKVKKGQTDYLKDMKDASGLLRAVTQFSHLAADTIVNGSATAHMAPTDHADRLTDNCRGCATETLQFLQELKSKPTLQRADPASARTIVQKILQLAQDLRPKGSDIRQEELGDLVDKEMASTSAAIEEAVRRIDEMVNQARKDTSGVKLEVNERILYSCTDLMKAIHLLVIASKDLQKEIVEGGRGAASIKEFYARNSRWTEGLISASKAVGWGATQMVESADKVVLHTGKYEELIVCSHEIAASTAQLVAASKVKADRDSKRLVSLQQASRRVNEMAANVVASTKTGQDQIEDKDTMDFSGMNLMKLKKEEIESQVRVLELESNLENERVRLGELRRKHYELAGSPLDPENDNNGVSNKAPPSPKPAKPSLFKKPSLPRKPSPLAKNPFR